LCVLPCFIAANGILNASIRSRMTVKAAYAVDLDQCMQSLMEDGITRSGRAHDVLHAQAPETRKFPGLPRISGGVMPVG
jgi:hypothetical protein